MGYTLMYIIINYYNILYSRDESNIDAYRVNEKNSVPYYYFGRVYFSQKNNITVFLRTYYLFPYIKTKLPFS